MTDTTEYTLRFDISKSEAGDLIDKVNKYLSAISHLWVFELGKTKKEHIHGYVKSKKSKIDTVRKWITRQPFYKGPSSFSVSVVSDKAKYLSYICKDMNILTTNITDEEQVYLIEEARKIKDDKGRSMVDKLFNFIVGDYIGDYDETQQTILTDRDVLDSCLKFYKTKKLLHPTKSQMFQYVQTILSLTNNDSSVFTDYYDIFIAKQPNIINERDKHGKFKPEDIKILLDV